MLRHKNVQRVKSRTSAVYKRRGFRRLTEKKIANILLHVMSELSSSWTETNTQIWALLNRHCTYSPVTHFDYGVTYIFRHKDWLNGRPVHHQNDWALIINLKAICFIMSYKSYFVNSTRLYTIYNFTRNVSVWLVSSFGFI